MKTKQLIVTTFLAALGVVTAHAQVSKPITKVPFVITKPGNYHLIKDLVLTKALPAGTTSAITVLVSDVTINLNGRVLSSTVNAVGGIGASAETLSGVRVQNGSIRGFENGLFLASNNGGGGFVVQDLFVEQCKATGLILSGANVTVRRCTVRAIGGTTGSGDPAGIAIFGNDAVVEDSTVADVSPSQGGNTDSGIATDGDGALIARCRVIKHGAQIENSVGLRIGGARNTLVDNQIINQDTGIAVFNVSSKFRDNVITDCATKSTGGTDAGNNK